MYKYDKLDQKYPVKINRITGETKVLTGWGWQDAEDYNRAAEEMAQYKDQILSEIESQNESIKQDVLLTIQEELDFISEKQESISTRPGNEVAESSEEHADDVIADPVNEVKSEEELIELGDTKETVKKIMGVPDTILGTDPFVMWYYGDSRIDFEDGKVSGWDNNGNLPLK